MQIIETIDEIHVKVSAKLSKEKSNQRKCVDQFKLLTPQPTVTINIDSFGDGIIISFDNSSIEENRNIPISSIARLCAEDFLEDGIPTQDTKPNEEDWKILEDFLGKIPSKEESKEFQEAFQKRLREERNDSR